tara:strand:+ start:27320 stop:28213 length:894 start_codon:yes stop_codon:yes gene_type:complete
MELPVTIELQEIENLGARQPAISHHYNVGNDFYELWLDPTMSYSCARWEDGDDLERAQIRKLDYHIDEARVEPGHRVLDIGCGWGGMISRMVRNRGAAHATGLTLSSEQGQYIRDRYQKNEGLKTLEVHVESWTDHVASGAYDAIVSVGAFEHFARLGLSKAQKIQAYRAFFERCHAWLKPGTSMSLQTCGYGLMAPGSGLDFIYHDIFPETELPLVEEVVEAAQGLFELRALRNDREDYVKTLNAWFINFRKNKAKVLEVGSPELFHRYEHYLGFCAIGFKKRNLLLHRYSFDRLD